MKVFMKPMLCLLLAVMGVSVSVAAPPWGTNLWVNGSFEEGYAGWTAVRGPRNETVEALELTDGCAGHRALRIVNPPDEGGVMASPALRLNPGWHLFAFWYRFELRGDTPPEQLVYVDRHTGAGAEQRRDSIYFYYHSPIADGAWQLAFLTFRLREGDTGVRFRFVAGARATALAIDAVQVRRLEPPADAGVVTSIETEAYGTERIADPDSPNGFAHRVAEGAQVRGGKTGGGTRFTSPPGVYRVTYRLRQEEAGEGPVLGLYVGGDGGKAMDDVQAGDFSGTGYRDVEVYWLYPFGMGCFPAWDWRGTGCYRFAAVTLARLQPLTARECWDLLADGVDVARVLPPAPALPEGTRAWVAAGLYTRETGIQAALKTAGLPFAQSFIQTARGGGLSLAPEMPDLAPLDVVVLSNIPSRAIPPASQLALQRFVEKGGTLIVLGGFYAYGHGGYQGSFLEELLPVSIRRPFDLTPVSAPLTEALPDAPRRLGGCAWAHDVAVKPGAKVLWSAGGTPGAAAWTVGKGRVMAVTATVLGEPTDPWWRHNAIGELF